MSPSKCLNKNNFKLFEQLKILQLLFCSCIYYVHSLTSLHIHTYLPAICTLGYIFQNLFGHGGGGLPKRYFLFLISFIIEYNLYPQESNPFNPKRFNCSRKLYIDRCSMSILDSPFPYRPAVK